MPQAPEIEEEWVFPWGLWKELALSSARLQPGDTDLRPLPTELSEDKSVLF